MVNLVEIPKKNRSSKTYDQLNQNYIAQGEELKKQISQYLKQWKQENRRPNIAANKNKLNHLMKKFLDLSNLNLSSNKSKHKRSKSIPNPSIISTSKSTSPSSSRTKSTSRSRSSSSPLSKHHSSKTKSNEKQSLKHKSKSSNSQSKKHFSKTKSNEKHKSKPSKKSTKTESNSKKSIKHKSKSSSYPSKKHSSKTKSDTKKSSRSKILSPKPLTCIEASKVPLKPHQINTVEHINNVRSFLAIHATGSGKTLLAITAASCFIKNYPERKVLIITKLSVIHAFEKELYNYGHSQQVIDKHFEIITHTTFANRYKNTDNKDFNPIFKNTMIIVDEIHNIKKLTSKSGQNLFFAARACKKILMQTATLATNNVGDLALAYAIITNTEPYSSEAFDALYNDPTTRKELLQKLQCHISFYDIAKSSDDFPKITNKRIVFIRMSDETQKFYTNIENSSKKREDFGAFYTKIRQTMNQNNDLSSVFSQKLIWLKSYLAHQKTRKRLRVIVYSEYKKNGVRLAAKLVEKEGYKFAVLTGEMSQSKRTITVNNFNNGLYDVLLITGAASEGVDFKGTRALVILEPDWTNSTYLQLIGRAVRYKSHTHLPQTQRNVQIKLLVLDKQQDFDNMIGKSSSQSLYHELPMKSFKPHAPVQVSQKARKQQFLAIDRDVSLDSKEKILQKKILRQKFISSKTAHKVSVDRHLLNTSLWKRDIIKGFKKNLRSFGIENNKDCLSS